MRFLLSLLFSVLALFSCTPKKSTQSLSPADYVDPFIGTGAHGHTYPGATAPFGLMQLSPDTRLEGWDGVSGYHYTDDVIYGFSHTHLSGTGIGDYCDILFQPVSGEVRLNNGADGKPGYRSKFSHDDESASPGYYQVRLQDYDVNVELTTTTRAGMHRYAFNKEGENSILVDLEHRNRVLDSELKIVSDTEIEGFRRASDWADDKRFYFVARFSKPFTQANLALHDTLVPGATRLNGKAVKGWFTFGSGKDTVLVKIGISAVSTENARMNLDAEIPHWSFDQVRKETHDKWNEELSIYTVNDEDAAKKTVFYTAVYHTMISTNVYSDVDGTYRGHDSLIHKMDSGKYYTIFSLWDTYRALHPLKTITDHKRTNEYINTFLKMYEQGGLLPVWELAGNETWCMIGYHAVPVIADAYAKGIRGYDAPKALEAMVKSAEQDHFGLKYYKAQGFISSEQEHESVSKTLEYGYDDWCIAEMAKYLGNTEVRDEFYLRSQAYKHQFDPQTGFMRARFNGGWHSPFTPEEVNFNYTEGNSWQYSFYVPHDISGLAEMHGGLDKLAAKLDELFSVSSQTTGREQVDITGLIGQYAHGNEPSHQIIYMYNYCGQPWKTQEKAHYIMREFYTTAPDGLIGNEDCGQMSAWAVFSAMGFYPVCPGDTVYAIGTPYFKEMSVKTAIGTTLTIKADKLSDKNFYIQSATLNGKPLERAYLTHNEIMQGGELIFVMGSSPNKGWGSDPAQFPKTALTGPQVLPAPYISPATKSFAGDEQFTITPVNGGRVYYTTDGSEPTLQSQLFDKPFALKNTGVVKFITYKDGFSPSGIQSAYFYKRPENLSLTLTYPFAKQYSANGPDNLIDGITGTEDFRVGAWQGFQEVNLEAVVRIGYQKPVKAVSVGFLQDENAWVFMPQKVELWSSADGTNFTKIGEKPSPVPPTQKGNVVHRFSFDRLNITDRYIKVVGVNMGTIPEWHKGAGGKAWLFADEITLDF